jgi:methyl-accepting chemotaxis protein
MNEHTRRRQPHDELNDLVGNIEQEIGQVVHRRDSVGGNATPKTLEDISRAAAEAMTMQYESLIRSVEDAHAATKTKIAKMVASLDQNAEETAAILEERGKVAMRLVEQIGEMTKAGREVCADVVRKVGG